MRRCLHKKAKPGSKKRLTKLDAQTNSSAASDVSTTEHAFQLPPEQITVLDTPSQLGHLIDAVHSALQNNQAVFNDPSSQSCKLLQLQPLALDCERVDKTPNISVVSIAVGSRHCFVCDVFKLDSHACKMYIDLLIDLLEGPCLPIFTPLATCRKGWGALEALRYHMCQRSINTPLTQLSSSCIPSINGPLNSTQHLRTLYMRMHEESTGFHAQRTSLTFPLHNDDAKLIPERPDWQQRPLEFRDLQYAAGAAMCQVHFYQMCARYSPDRVYQLLQLNPATA